MSTSIATSIERWTAKTQIDYTGILGRPATAAEEGYWTNRFANGAAEAELLAGLVSSEEFYYRADGTAGSAREWVNQAYQRLLGRAPTWTEIDFWFGVLTRAK